MGSQCSRPEMALRIFIAGGPGEEKASVEALVKEVLAPFPAEAWTVSLVKVQARWSVTLDGGRVRGLTFVSSPARLRASFLEALANAGLAAGEPIRETAAPVPVPRPGPVPVPRPGPGPAPPRAPGPRRDEHACADCGMPFAVLYELTAAGEPLSRVAVACPHCWKNNYVDVGESAASARDYRAEKA